VNDSRKDQSVFTEQPYEHRVVTASTRGTHCRLLMVAQGREPSWRPVVSPTEAARHHQSFDCQIIRFSTARIRFNVPSNTGPPFTSLSADPLPLFVATYRPTLTHRQHVWIGYSRHTEYLWGCPRRVTSQHNVRLTFLLPIPSLNYLVHSLYGVTITQM
jgi:hypothetical protein